MKYLNEIRQHAQISTSSGGRQVVRLARHCLSVETIIHETMHGLGFWHEHQRPDRDEFIYFDFDKLKERFQKTRGKCRVFCKTFQTKTTVNSTVPKLQLSTPRTTFSRLCIIGRMLWQRKEKRYVP